MAPSKKEGPPSGKNPATRTIFMETAA